jgi:ferredoxin-thioredoxin reductase catalytic subunit
MRIKLNPNKKFVEELREEIKNNDGYCPCKIERTNDTICPCKDFRYNQECCCELYIKEED